MVLKVNGGCLEVDFSKGIIKSLVYKDIEVCAKPSPIFNVRLTDVDGAIKDYSSLDAKSVVENGDERFVRIVGEYIHVRGRYAL